MFPERMRALRRGRGLTLGQLAQALNEMNVSYRDRGNTATQLSKWECGVNMPSYLDVRQLAEFFGVSTDYLCGRAVDRVDLVEALASSAEVSFGAQTLDTNEKGELYGLIRGYLRGRKDRGQHGSVEENGEVQLRLEDFDEENNCH